MKISEKWLRSFVEINKPIEEIASILTLRGLEFESITPVAANLNNIVVAEIVKAEQHPNADRLRVCQVNGGEEILTIVCGAPNARAGIKVALAKIGAVLPQVTIKKSKIRDVESHGMLCSVSELGLADKSEGIMELPLDAPIGKSLTEYLALDDNILDISITPNRGDCASVLGIAREVAAIDGATWRHADAVNVEVAGCSPSDMTTKNHASTICPIYLTTKVENLNPKTETPIWMKERLRRSGIRSINVPVDATNYVMLACGQPLHAFDAQKISGDIEVRFAKENEKLELLNDITITLDEQSLIIADNEGPIALAGIMGGKKTAVSETTTEIIVECAHFIPENIARTARKFNLNSDSSYRFERGVDPRLPESALAHTKKLIAAIANKKEGASTSDGVAEGSVDHGWYGTLVHGCTFPRNAIEAGEHHTRAKINLRYNKLERVLGIKISEKEIKKYFTALNLAFEEKTAEGLIVAPPTYRTDLNIEEDLIEEVLRMHGCDAIPEIAPTPNLSLQVNLMSTNIDAERLILKTRGYNEIISYSFVDEKLQLQLLPEVNPLTLKNPISQEMSVMRTTLWTGLIATLTYNLHRQQTRSRLFEVGLCFINNEQTKKLAGLCYGTIESENWKNSKEVSHFYDIKNDVVALLAENHLENKYEFLLSTHSALHPTQSARIVHKHTQQVLGEIGVLHPRLVQALELPMAPVLFEIDVNLLKSATTCQSFAPLSKFPEVRRDLSFLLPATISYQAIKEAIQPLGKESIQRVFVFDVYQGKGVPDGHRSIAIALILQAFSKTLTDEEVANLIQKVIDLMREQFGATLRD